MSTRRHSIQRQIVGPVTGMLALTVTLVSLLCAYLSTRQLERSLALQIERITKIMRESSFPLSANVLARMREISGAHFVVWDKVGRIGATTFEDVDLVEQLRPHLHTHVGKGNIADLPAVRLAGELYFVKVARHDFPSQESVMILYPRSELTVAQWRAVAIPLLVGLGGVVAMMLMMRSVSIRLTHRLEEVHNRVADIAEGDFREIPAENVPDEIGDLISSVNDMARRIRSMHELIGRTERARVLGQLAGGLAHQMRNALTGTRLAIQIHERRCLTAKEEESLAVALQQLSVMEEHMKRLLSVGKHEKRAIKWFHVRVLLDEVESLVEPFSKHSRVGIDRSLPTLKVLQIHGDSDGLRNALLNLVMNGIEAAGPGGQVEVKAYPENDDVVFEVYDNGPGPPPEIAAQLFEPFVSGKSEGVGLGLAVVRQTAMQHQGSVMWERIEGKTCFRIRLPKIPSRMLNLNPPETPVSAPDDRDRFSNPLTASHSSQATEDLG